MDATVIVAAAISTYAAIISTLSLFLAIKVYRAGNPKVELDWLYIEDERMLTLSVMNIGRSAVTITSIDLYIVREEIASRSPGGRYFNAKWEPVGAVPVEAWRQKSSMESQDFPLRLDSNSMISLRVDGDAIQLPPSYSVEELLLRFVARFPAGKTDAYLRGDVLRHFVGIEPDRPVTLPSPGSVPAEE